MRAVARKYAIPVTTLHDQKSKKIEAGGPTVLTASEEHEIVLALDDMGFGLTRELISKVIHDYIHTHDKGITKTLSRMECREKTGSSDFSSGGVRENHWHIMYAQCSSGA